MVERILRLLTCGVILFSTPGFVFGQLGNRDRREIAGLIAEFEQAVEDQDRDAIERTLSPEMPEGKKREIVEAILTASENWTIEYRIDVSPSAIQGAGAGEASVSAHHAIRGRRGGANWNLNSDCRFGFKKVGGDEDSDEPQWKISETSAHSTFQLKTQAAQFGQNIAQNARGFVWIGLGVCLAVVVVLGLVVFLIVWLIVRAGRPKQSPMPPRA